jgi:hypothetical protein
MAIAAPTTFSTQCEQSSGMLTIWAGAAASGDQFRVDSVDLGTVTKHQVLTTDDTETCLNPQTGDAGLNPQTGDAGLSADEMGDLVVLNVHEDGEPIAIIALFESGVVHINMQSATAFEAARILEEEGRVEAASAVHARLPEGALKTAFSALF